jgi:signal transduction histidine kinase
MRLKLWYSTIFFVLLISNFVFAQSNGKSENQKLEDWNIYCDKLKGIPSGVENYPELIKAALAGIKMTPADNWFYQSVFNFHLAGGYESTYRIDSAIHYYEISKNYGERAKSNSRIVLALRRLAGLYDNKQLTQKANAARNQLSAIAKIDPDEEIQVGANIVLGEYYFNAGMFEKALENYLIYIKYLKIDYARSNNSASKSNIGVGYLAVGEIYQNLNRPTKSLPYFKDAINYLDNYQEGLETAYKDLVSSYIAVDLLDSARLYYQRLKKSVEKSRDITILIDAQAELGKAFINKNNLKQAFQVLSEAEKNVSLSKEKEDFYTVKIALGDYYVKTNNSKRALAYYQEALPFALYYKNKSIIARLYYSLAVEEKKQNDQNGAYAHMVLYAKYTDSLKTESISKNIVEMEARFQNEIKQQQIGVLNKENEIKNLQLQQEKRTKWLLGGAAVLLLFALSLIYLNYRNKQKANLLLDKKNQQLDIINVKLNESNLTKTKLFSIISHDLRSPVSQLFTFLKLQQKNASLISAEEREVHQQKLITSSKHLLETMEDLLLWSKSQMENFELDMQEVDVLQLLESVSLSMEAQAEAKNINIEIGHIGLKSLYSDENLLIIILRNLLQNAINHAYADSFIVMNADKDINGRPYLTVNNRGDEIPSDKIAVLLNHSNIQSKSSGYGLLIVKELALKINAELNISNNAESGTEISLVFKG